MIRRFFGVSPPLFSRFRGSPGFRSMVIEWIPFSGPFVLMEEPCFFIDAHLRPWLFSSAR